MTKRTLPLSRSFFRKPGEDTKMRITNILKFNMKDSVTMQATMKSAEEPPTPSHPEEPQTPADQKKSLKPKKVSAKSIGDKRKHEAISNIKKHFDSTQVESLTWAHDVCAVVKTVVADNKLDDDESTTEGGGRMTDWIIRLIIGISLRFALTGSLWVDNEQVCKWSELRVKIVGMAKNRIGKQNPVKGADAQQIANMLLQAVGANGPLEDVPDGSGDKIPESLLVFAWELKDFVVKHFGNVKIPIAFMSGVANTIQKIYSPDHATQVQMMELEDFAALTLDMAEEVIKPEWVNLANAVMQEYVDLCGQSLAADALTAIHKITHNEADAATCQSMLESALMVTTEVIAHVATAHVSAKVLPNASPALPGLAFVPTHLAQIATLENSMLSSKQGRSERIAMWTDIFASVTPEAQLASLDSIKTNVDAAAMASVGTPGPALLAPTPHQPADDEGKEVPSQCSIDTVFMIHPTTTTQVPTPHEGNSLVSLTDRCSCYSLSNPRTSAQTSSHEAPSLCGGSTSSSCTSSRCSTITSKMLA